jgi:outer membrane protein assembly factor BamB
MKHFAKMVVAFAVGVLLCVHAEAASLVYFSDTAHSLYTFDTTTGNSTLRAAVPGILRFFGMDNRPSDGVVFAVNYDNSVASGLYAININTGSYSLVGSMGVNEMVGLAFNPLNGQLFGLRHLGGLYAINQNTGAASLIGPTDIAGTSDIVNRGLVFSPSGQLFGFNTSGHLYSLNPATGTPTSVGGSGNTISENAEDAAFAADGTLYATDFFGTIFRTDPVTGNGTVVGTGKPSLLGIIALPIPEPSSAMLLAALGTAVWLRRRPRGVRTTSE